MNSLSVSIYLTTLLLLVVLFLKRIVGKGASIKVMYWLLFLMFTPGFILDIQKLYFWGEVGIANISLFFVLLILTTIPWITFDKWYKKIPSIMVTDKGARVLGPVFFIVIISCFFSYIYIYPYALKSFALGAMETRNIVNAHESVMPANYLTTFAVGVSSISPFYVFFFYLSMLHPWLRKYSFGLFISSFIYIVVSMPFMSRDGFVTLPLFYIIFYLIFAKSLEKKDTKRVKRYFSIITIVSGSLMLIYSVSRFFDGSYNNSYYGFISGTWGYLFQQPYVFDRTIIFQHDWHGVGLRFPILSVFSETPVREVIRNQDFETRFGTMLAEFYSIGGYWSLYAFTTAFIFIYYFGLRILIHQEKYFSIFLFFITYLMIEVTGLFYYRYGGSTFNWLFLILTLLPFILKNKILTIRQ